MLNIKLAQETTISKETIMKMFSLAVIALAFAGTIAVAAQPADKKQGNAPRLKLSPPADSPAADNDEDASEKPKKPAARPAKPGPGIKLSTEGKKKPDEAETLRNLSFMLGFNTGKQISQFEELGVKVDIEVVIQALRDAAEGKPGMEEEESQEAAAAIHQYVQEKSAAKNKRDGAKFLAENKKEEGVKALPSGLQYKVLKSGKGEKPKKSDTVRVHYKGSFANGMEFESSYRMGQPLSIPVDKVIAGWTEALQLMKVGDKWKLFIPSDMAYGENGMLDRQGNQRIPPNATLVFEVELLGIEKGSKGPALK